jgi:glutathione peroxidase-family protein
LTHRDKILNEGWEKRSTIDEPRLSELVKTYEELGFEVLLAPFDPYNEPGCTECMKTSPQHYRIIYTRKL